MSLDKTKVNAAFSKLNVQLIINTVFKPVQIKPVPIQKTLILVNNFIINTSQFFNAFSENIERKISCVSNKITEIEILLAVLEVKLNSIPGLEFEADNLPNAAPPGPSAGESSGATASAPPNAAPPASVPAPAAPDISAIDEDPPPAAKPTSLADNPEYESLCKMLRVRVPLPVVLGKAASMGLDPNLLEEYFNSL